ncbi:MAG: lysophospholipid acyltransferase family protein [Nitrospirota bacterium]
MTLVNRLKLWLIPPIGYAAIRALGRTLRIRTLHADRVNAFWQAGRPVILAFWHGRQLMLPLGYGGSRLYILVSEHRDGELIHRIVRRFGFDTVRGSTTRGGARALRQMVRLGRSGAGLAVTPDGPKGPRCVAQAGVVQLAKLTGLPILPYTFAASKKNSSGAGTASKSRCRSAGPVMHGASPSGCRPMPIARSLRRSGWQWRRRSTSSAMRRIAR